MSEEAVEPVMLRITAELPADAAGELVDLAEAKGLTLSEAIRRSIITEAFLQRKRDAGGKILVDQGGKLTELVFLR